MVHEIHGNITRSHYLPGNSKIELTVTNDQGTDTVIVVGAESILRQAYKIKKATWSPAPLEIRAGELESAAKSVAYDFVRAHRVHLAAAQDLRHARQLSEIAMDAVKALPSGSGSRVCRERAALCAAKYGGCIGTFDALFSMWCARQGIEMISLHRHVVMDAVISMSLEDLANASAHEKLVTPDYFLI